MRQRYVARTLALSIAVIACATTASCSTSNAFAYSGTVQAESAAVGSTIGGRVVAVLVSPGQRVKGGQVLVRLDDSQQRATLAQAVAQLDQAQAAVAGIQAGSTQAERARAQAQTQQAAAGYSKASVASVDVIRTAQLAVSQAQANLAKAEAASANATANASRIQKLYSQGAVSAQNRDTAIADAHQGQDVVAVARAQLAMAQSQLQATTAGVAAGDVGAARAAYEAAAASQRGVEIGAPTQAEQTRAAAAAARAAVDAARARLAEMTIRAPADGIIENLDLHRGDLIAPSAPVATVSEFRDPYVRIFVPQRELSRIGVGKAVRVRSDAVPGKTFDGTVQSIDTTAQFTPQNVQTKEDRAGLDFGVKIVIHDPERQLLAGTTAEVALP